jgi:hypothetical protein
MKVASIKTVNDIMHELYEIQACIQLCRTGTSALQDESLAVDKWSNSKVLDGVDITLGGLSKRVADLLHELDLSELRIIKSFA